MGVGGGDGGLISTARVKIEAELRVFGEKNRI
jgi:hypothetical protein